MIDLHFGKYGIKTADRLNIVLYEKVENTKPESKNFGKISEKVLGYYSRLEDAINANVKTVMADDSWNITSIEETIRAINFIQNSIKYECKGLQNKIKAFEEKQTPKKVVFVDGGEELLCPYCGIDFMGTITELGHEPYYCFECGQALDWGQEE